MIWIFLCTRISCSSGKQLLNPTNFLPTLSTHLFLRPQFEDSRVHSLSANDFLINEAEVDALHGKVFKDGSFAKTQTGNYLLDLRVKSRNLENALKVFDEILDRDVRTWTILLSGLARAGFFWIVLALIREMQNEGVSPNHFTLSSVLKSCSRLNELRMGKSVHAWTLRNRLAFDVALENSLLDLYVKCGKLISGKRLFELMKDRNTISWNIMTGAYLQFGLVDMAMELFRSLPVKDVASWNTIIDGLMRNACERTAMELLYEMVSGGPQFGKATFSIALVLVSSFSNLKLGKQLHCRILRCGIPIDGFIRGSLLGMYGKCGQMKEATTLYTEFSRTSIRKEGVKSFLPESVDESVSRNSLISGFIQNGQYEEALRIFTSLFSKHVTIDKFTLTSVVSACASSGTLGVGQQVHTLIHKIGHVVDAHLASSFVDMYAKCGCLEDARVVFEETSDLNVVVWTSMILGFALYGQGREAAQLFECMIKEGMTPNEVTFVGVLTACSHAGLVEHGLRYYNLMKALGIKPGVEHFTCMVDLYGRAGCLNEAKVFIQENGLSEQTAVWRAFLSCCRLHKDIKMAKWVSEKLLCLDPLYAEPYVLLSNMFSVEHRWDEAAELRSLMQKKGVKKAPGQSWIQIKSEVHTFVMGDRSHPQDFEIYAYLGKLAGRLREIGYSSDLNQVMQDVGEEQGEMLLGFHSEKLALACGIINTPSDSRIPIRIIKNLRVCIDCHNFFKYASQLTGREIVVRDIHRFHHFKNGSCSCSDYW